MTNKGELSQFTLLLLIGVAICICAAYPAGATDLRTVGDMNNNKIDDNLENEARLMRADDTIDVIVLYHQPRTTAHRSASASATLTSKRLASKTKYDYKIIGASALEMPAGNLEDLARDPGVKAVYPDYMVHALLDTSIPVIKADQARAIFGVFGKNVTIAVLDTGIDANHTSLDDLDDDPATDDNKVIAFRDFVNEQDDAPYDDEGHGTHCAGIAAGTAGGSDYAGVAPMSTIVGVKVLNETGYGATSDCIAGIEWCIAEKDAYGIDILSISWGSDVNGDGTSPMEIACDRAVDSGIVVCVAAGNDGSESGTIRIPASAEKVITVGAITDYLDSASFSSRGPTTDGRIKPDVCAVGVGVSAPDANSGDGYALHSGTSMSTPHVSGLAAMIIEYNPHISPSEIKEILCNTSTDLGNAGCDNIYGWGVVNATAALDEIGTIRIPLETGSTYDPGDRVTITGSTSNETTAIPAVITITTTAPDGSVVASDTTTSESDGSFSVGFTLPGNSEPGDYGVEVVASHNNEIGRRAINFKVGTLVILMDAPEYAVTGTPYLLSGCVKSDECVPVPGSDINVSISSANGTAVYTSHDHSDDSGNFSVTWTPPDVGRYTVKITARDWGTSKVGINGTTFWSPYGVMTASVLDSWGTDHNESAIWGEDDLNKNWHLYGDYLVDIDYTTLDMENITYDDLVSSGSDLLIISCAWEGGGWEFTDDEISAISRYVRDGHGIIATAGTFDSSAANNIGLAQLFGMAEIAGNMHDTIGVFMLYYSDHPLFEMLDDPYYVRGLTTNYPWDTTTGSVLARSEDGYSAIITNSVTGTDSGYASVYFNHFPELDDGGAEPQLFYNAIVWTGTSHPMPDHDLGISRFRHPERIDCDGYARFGVTVENNGLHDETDVALNMSVNGVVINTTTIPVITSGSEVPLNLSWAPKSPGRHDLNLSVAAKGSAGYCDDVAFNDHLSTKVDVPVARFDCGYSDCGVDTDFDGLYDHLAIDVGMDVMMAGSYTIKVDLNDRYGACIESKINYTHFDSGKHIVRFNFTGIAIEDNGVDGPYYLKHLGLYDDSWTHNRLDYIPDAYTTAPYNHTEFQPHRAIVLIDRTHRTDKASQYSRWTGSITDMRFLVRDYNGETINESTFEGCDVFVIPQALDPYTPVELSAIRSFVAGGGGLFVIGDQFPHIYTNLTEFAGICWGKIDGHNETATDITPHKITDRVTSVYLPYPSSKIMVGGNAMEIVRNDEYDVMLAIYEGPGSGRVVGFVDEDSFKNPYIESGDNMVLGENIIEWLSGGAGTGHQGDLDCDGEITTADSVIALEMSVQGVYVAGADMDNDGVVDSLDALMIAQSAGCAE